MSTKVDGPMVRRFHLRIDQPLKPGATIEQRCRWCFPPATALDVAALKTYISREFDVRQKFLIVMDNSTLADSDPVAGIDRDAVLYLQRAFSAPPPASKSRNCCSGCGEGDRDRFSKTQWERRLCKGLSARCLACIEPEALAKEEADLEDAGKVSWNLPASSPREIVTGTADGADVESVEDFQEAERREADDGYWYTAAEFMAYYGSDAADRWAEAEDRSKGRYVTVSEGGSRRRDKPKAARVQQFDIEADELSDSTDADSEEDDQLNSDSDELSHETDEESDGEESDSYSYEESGSDCSEDRQHDFEHMRFEEYCCRYCGETADADELHWFAGDGKVKKGWACVRCWDQEYRYFVWGAPENMLRE